MGALQDKTVVVVGRGSGDRKGGCSIGAIGRCPCPSSPSATKRALAEAYRDDPNIHADTVDITDDTSIAALADRVGSVDHVVSTASARARGKLADLQREDLQRSTHRHCRRHCQRCAVRHDQHLHDRCDPQDRRRRTADLTPSASIQTAPQSP